jgi:hypothetical protein
LCISIFSSAGGGGWVLPVHRSPHKVKLSLCLEGLLRKSRSGDQGERSESQRAIMNMISARKYEKYKYSLAGGAMETDFFISCVPLAICCVM